FFSSRRRHTRFSRDWSSDVCSSDLVDRLSGFRTDPLGRAARSFASVQTWVYGGRTAIEEGRRLREMHKPLSAVDEEGRRHHALSDRKSTRLNSSHVKISYAVFCLKK